MKTPQDAPLQTAILLAAVANVALLINLLEALGVEPNGAGAAAAAAVAFSAVLFFQWMFGDAIGAAIERVRQGGESNA